MRGGPGPLGDRSVFDFVVIVTVKKERVVLSLMAYAIP